MLQTYMECKTLPRWGLGPSRPRKCDPVELFSFVQVIIRGSCFYYHSVYLALVLSSPELRSQHSWAMRTQSSGIWWGSLKGLGHDASFSINLGSRKIPLAWSISCIKESREVILASCHRPVATWTPSMSMWQAQGGRGRWQGWGDAERSRQGKGREGYSPHPCLTASSSISPFSLWICTEFGGRLRIQSKLGKRDRIKKLRHFF